MWLSLIEPITLRAEAARAREARVRELGIPDVDTYLSDRIRGRLVSAHRGEPNLEAAYVPDDAPRGHRGRRLVAATSLVKRGRQAHSCCPFPHTPVFGQPPAADTLTIATMVDADAPGQSRRGVSREP